jgi:hypothetical protein
MAEAIRAADSTYSPTHIRAQSDEDAFISPNTQAPGAWEPVYVTLTSEQRRARRTRSIAIALALGAFVAVIFAVTIVRLGSGALMRPMYMRPVQPTQGTK